MFGISNGARQCVHVWGAACTQRLHAGYSLRSMSTRKSWFWQQLAKSVSIFAFWEKVPFLNWLQCKGIKPSCIVHFLHVCEWGPINSQTHRRALIHPWLRALGPHSSNTKGILDDILLTGTTKRAAVWLDSDVSPLFSTDRWPITATYSLICFTLFVQELRLSLNTDIGMCTHTHPLIVAPSLCPLSLRYVHTHTQAIAYSCSIKEASSRAIKEVPSSVMEGCSRKWCLTCQMLPSD